MVKNISPGIRQSDHIAKSNHVYKPIGYLLYTTRIDKRDLLIVLFYSVQSSNTHSQPKCTYNNIRLIIQNYSINIPSR